MAIFLLGLRQFICFWYAVWYAIICLVLTNSKKKFSISSFGNGLVHGYSSPFWWLYYSDIIMLPSNVGNDEISVRVIVLLTNNCFVSQSNVLGTKKMCIRDRLYPLSLYFQTCWPVLNLTFF